MGKGAFAQQDAASRKRVALKRHKELAHVDWVFEVSRDLLSVVLPKILFP